MNCRVCSSIHLKQINEDVCGGLSLRVIGKKYGIGIATLSRHRPHIPPGELQAAVIVPPSTGTLSDQLRALIEDTRRVARKAEQSGHLQSAVAALKTINGHLELLAKLSGELQTGSVAVGVNIDMRQAWQQSSKETLRWALARHIAHTYSFDPDFIDNLKLMADAPCPECKRFRCPHDLL